jgi:Na+-transporting methylmalonyl-CoA/oxaloacetate decarboxylase beta subunit
MALLIGVITLLTRRAHSVSIIGGADGPTSIFLAGKVDHLSLIIGLVAGAAIVVAGVILVIKSKKS